MHGVTRPWLVVHAPRVVEAGMIESMPPDDVALLAGCVVNMVSFDYQVRLLLVDGAYGNERVSASLVIEAPIELRDGELVHEVRPGEPQTLPPMLDLLHRTVRNATFDGRTLTLLFDNGVVVTVVTAPTMESWNLSGRGVRNLIVGPWCLTQP